MATTIGLVHLTLNVAQAMTLKDKRRVIQGFKARVRHTHNVSVAEVDNLDSLRWSVLAVAMVGNDRRYVEGGLQTIINAAARHRDMILTDTQIEWL